MNTKHYILLMAAALMMAGCAFDDPMEKQKPWEETDSDLPKPVTFSVSTANSLDLTRAEEYYKNKSIVTFNKDEKIRVLVKPMDSGAYSPYDYTTKEEGQSVELTAPDPQPYFPAGFGTTVDAYAYYPATASTSSSEAFTVADYQRDSAYYKASDLMMAENRTITKDVNDDSNKLTMKHLMAQLRIKAVPDSASDLKITKILVEAKKSLFFTPEGETITTTTGEIGTIIVLNEIDLAGGTGGEGYVLFPPQAINGVTIKVVTGTGRPREIATYSFASDKFFEAGASYGVDITVTPEQLGFTTAIANWNGMGSVIIAPSGDLIIDPIDAQPYADGDPITPPLTVRRGTTPLEKGVHYKVDYINNTQVGTAYAVVMGLKGTDSDGPFDYTSSCGVAPFKITAAMARISYGEFTDTTVVYGCQPFIFEHLFNDGDGSVTYTSENTSIATVDAITGKVTILKPGDVTIKATVEDGANFIYNETAREASYTIHVERAAGSIKFDDNKPSQEWNADESKNYFTQSATHLGTGAVTYTIPAKNTENNTCGASIDGSTIHFTQGGQVVVTATAADDDYYTYDAESRTATYTLTVTKAKGFVNLSAYSGSVPCEQEQMLFSVGNNHGGTLTVASNDTTIAKATISGGNVHVYGKSADSTKIVVTCAATAQYQEAKAEFTVTVSKIAITGMTAPTAKDLTYTGSAQALVNAGGADYGTMQYRLATNQAWSNSIPTATNAGTYQVYWQLAGDKNHSTYTAPEPVEVTIAKAAPTYTAPTAKNLTYNGSAQALVNAGSTSHGEIQYSKNGTSGWGTSVPTETASGKYTVYWKVVGDANHNNSNVSSISVTINPKAQSSPTITLSPTSCTYNGSAQKPSVTVKDGSATIDASEYTVTYSNNVNAGTATVTITDKEGGNYTVSGTKTFTINPKTVSSPTIALATTSYTYDGNAKQPGVSSVKDGSTTIASSEYTVSYSNNVNAGTATVTISDKSGGNYTVSGSTTFTINRQKLTSTNFKFASATLNKTYIWEIGTSTNALTKPSNCTVTYSSNNTGVASVNSSSGALTPGGTLNAYATITATATGNYEGTATYQIKAANKVQNFGYTGGIQGITVCKGRYQVEAWGAQGGNMAKGTGYDTSTAASGGYGGYARGTWTTSSATTLYIGVGGQASTSAGGYNGGGAPSLGGAYSVYYAGGGGGTHIAYGTNRGVMSSYNSYRDQLLVIGGGGGGAACYYKKMTGGTGGGTTIGNVQHNAWTSTAVDSRTAQTNGVLGAGDTNCGSGYSSGKQIGAGNNVWSGSGGTGYVKSGLTSTANSAGQRAGHGYARVTWVGN